MVPEAQVDAEAAFLNVDLDVEAPYDLAPLADAEAAIQALASSSRCTRWRSSLSSASIGAEPGVEPERSRAAGLRPHLGRIPPQWTALRSSLPTSPRSKSRQS